MTDQLVYVRGPISKVHVAVQHDGELLSNEKCQLDDVKGEREILDEMPLDIDQETLCERCFPKQGEVVG
jgi:hypothetical protein